MMKKNEVKLPPVPRKEKIKKRSIPPNPSPHEQAVSPRILLIKSQSNLSILG